MSFTISQGLLKLVSIESVMPSNHLILFCHLLLLPQSFPASGAFPVTLHQVVKILELQHQFFSEFSGWISFRINWFDILSVQGALKSLLQHHSSKASILWHSALLHSPTLSSIHDHRKTIALTRWTLVGKVCLCF